MFDTEGTRVEIWITKDVDGARVRTHPLGTFSTPTGPARVHEVNSEMAAKAVADSLQPAHDEHFLESWRKMCEEIDRE